MTTKKKPASSPKKKKGKAQTTSPPSNITQMPPAGPPSEGDPPPAEPPQPEPTPSPAPPTHEPPPAMPATPPLPPEKRITHYREETCTRYLKVPFADSERETHAKQLAETFDQISAVEADKKAATSEFNHRIEEVEARQKRLSGFVRDGYRQSEVNCKWHFERAGVDSNTKELIYHPNMKTLLREDNGEVVEVIPMAQTDYQKEELSEEVARTASPPVPTPEPQPPTHTPPPSEEQTGEEDNETISDSEG